MAVIEKELQPDLLNSANEEIKKNIIEEISRFGITPDESKIYLFLSKSDPKTANEVSKLLKLPRTKTYNLLATLQNKGIVNTIFGKPNKFEAMPLENAIQFLLDSERNRIYELASTSKELLLSWNKLPSSNTKEEMLSGNRLQILQGKNSILEKIKQLIQTTKREILVLGSQNDYLRFYHTDFFKIIRNTKANLKILTSFSEKTKYIFDPLPSKKIKKFNENLEDLFFIIKDDHEIIFFITLNQDNDNIIALWSDSKTLINSLKLTFNLIWSKSNYLNSSDDIKTETHESLDHMIKELDQEKVLVESLRKFVSKTKVNPKSNL